MNPNRPRRAGWKARSSYKPRSVRRAVSNRLGRSTHTVGAIIYLHPTSRLGSSGRPGARRERATPRPEGLRSCLALLLAGVAWPPTLLPTPVVSYTTFSPLPESQSTTWSRQCGLRCFRLSGGRFLWSYPRVAPPGGYPAPCSRERGLSSDVLRQAQDARDRPDGRTYLR
jgi:hypothetical protein